MLGRWLVCNQMQKDRAKESGNVFHYLDEILWDVAGYTSTEECSPPGS